MATRPVDPKLNRKNVKFTVNGNEYQIKMANSRTQGSLFAHMGYSDLGENNDENAIPMSLQDALGAGLIIKLNATCQVGNRTVTRVVYCPTPKVEETFRQGAGKTIGTLKVVKIRSPHRRVYS